MLEHGIAASAALPSSTLSRPCFATHTPPPPRSTGNGGARKHILPQHGKAISAQVFPERSYWGNPELPLATTISDMALKHVETLQDRVHLGLLLPLPLQEPLGLAELSFDLRLDLLQLWARGGLRANTGADTLAKLRA